MEIGWAAFLNKGNDLTLLFLALSSLDRLPDFKQILYENICEKKSVPATGTVYFLYHTIREFLSSNFGTKGLFLVLYDENYKSILFSK